MNLGDSNMTMTSDTQTFATSLAGLAILGTVFGFVDGHVKLMNWGQVRANDFRIFKAAKPSTTYNP